MMHALRPSSIFRPSSRPSSPAPVPSPRSDTFPSAERAPRAITKLSSLTTFRRPSPAPSGASSPAPAIIQDGSYLEVLSLRLSEIVSKSLASPASMAQPQEMLNGKKPIPTGRGRALGTLIETELNASRDNPHLRKAVLRTLQRPLSTLLSSLSTQLLPLISSPAFPTPPAPAQPLPHFNSTQLHAIALATFAGELLGSLDKLGLGHDDGLRGVREGLASVIGRVVNPLVATIKSEILPLISALEQPCSSSSSVAAALGPKSASKPQHPSIATLQTVMPHYSRALTRLFAIPTTHPTLATFSISLVWRALVAIAHRVPSLPTPPSTPGPSLSASSTRRHRSLTPPSTPPASKLMRKLPSSRPPSPARSAGAIASDARALYDILCTLPRPDPVTHLAREAVDDAFSGLRELVGLLEIDYSSCLWHTGHPDILAADLTAHTTELPTLIALPVLLNALVVPPHSESWRSVSAMLGMGDAEYRQGCLTGFGRVEECTPSVGKRVLEEL
ncbi:hypothetical protein K488DRAFT_22795, partial [Vararia minispora EC-137]